MHVSMYIYIYVYTYIAVNIHTRNHIHMVVSENARIALSDPFPQENN